jgi:hypothetical protein
MKEDLHFITEAAHISEIEVRFAQMGGLADSVSLLLLHMDYEVAKVSSDIPTSTGFSDAIY